MDERHCRHDMMNSSISLMLLSPRQACFYPLLFNLTVTVEKVSEGIMDIFDSSFSYIFGISLLSISALRGTKHCIRLGSSFSYTNA